MEIKRLSQEQLALLKEPLPEEAVKPHPTKNYLSTINSIYVTERLNDVFGVGAWSVASEIIDNTQKMVVVKTTLAIPDYGIRYESFGGNDNADRGDAHKGAVTDAITKIGSWLGIGADVWKEKSMQQEKQQKKRSKKDASAEDEGLLLVAIDEVRRASTIDQLKELWSKWHCFQHTEAFIKEKDKRKTELAR